MKKFLTAAVIFCLIFSATKVFAHEIFWYDRNSDFDRFAKIVLFPLSNAWDAPDDYQLGGEGTRNFTFNSYVDDRLTKKLKKINFIRLANEIREKDDILNNNLGILLQPFADEKSRAQAVEETTMADMYIVPRFRENRVQEDISPRCEWNVQLKSWTEEIGGPEGYKIYDEKKYTVRHVIPEAKIYLHIMQLEFTGYDNSARKILTGVAQNRSYGVTELTQFHTLVDDFQKAFTEAREGKNNSSGRFRVGFTPIAVAGEFGDEHMSNAMDFALEDEAIKRIKNARIVVGAKNSVPVDYYVRSNVTRCELIPHWNAPSYLVYNSLLKTEKRKWRDKDDKEHEATVNYYEQKISDRYAYWSFYWAVAADFWLVTPDNSVVISESYRETDDKPVDAFKHAAEDFCKLVNNFLKD